MSEIILTPLEEDDREQFILDNQESFRYGALEEFGERNDRFEEPGEVISRKTIEKCIDDNNSETYRIIWNKVVIGGTIVKIDRKTNVNELEILFIKPEYHSKGLGQMAWKAIESKYHETKKWITFTPYFEKRNIHFYVNRCGFHITEFFNEFHKDPNEPDCDGFDGMFRFEKNM